MRLHHIALWCSLLITGTQRSAASECSELFRSSRDQDGIRYFFVTGNERKWQEFQQLSDDLPLSRIDVELPEIEADHLRVAIHKASQLPYSPREAYLVEDSAFYIAGQRGFGPNIKWQVHRVGEHVGSRARWDVFLAYRTKHEVVVYHGYLEGRIVNRRHPMPGFGGFFLPNGYDRTIAESRGQISARRNAFLSFKNKVEFGRFPLIKDWSGRYQGQEAKDGR